MIARRSFQNPLVLGFLLWLALVVTLSVQHALWRDEVRAFSLALNGDTIPAMLEGLRGEGHPFLWYLLLRLAHDLAPIPQVLPITAVAIAAAAVALFLRRAPFQPWLKLLFIFSALPAFEYSVLARNYGISMLLIFAFAALYPARDRHPIRLGVILLALANTNVHSAALVPLFLFVWLMDRGPPSRAKIAAAALALLGILLCALTVWPTVNDLIATRPRAETLDFAIGTALLLPGHYFSQMLPLPASRLGPVLSPVLQSLALFLLPIGLTPRKPLFLAALAALWGMALLFAVVYPGDYRHQGLWLVFILSLYWIALDAKTVAPLALSQRVILPAFLATQLALSLVTIPAQSARPFSESATLAALLRATPDLHDAILLAEPDFDVEALPYYLANPTYLPRESRFGNRVIFTTRAQRDLSLGDLLDRARQLHRDHNVPVVILLAHPLPQTDADTAIAESYGWTFRTTRAQRQEFRAATRLIASLHGTSTGDEEYDVYRLP